MNKAGSRPEGVKAAYLPDVIGCLVAYQGFALGLSVQFENVRDEVRVVHRLAISHKLQEFLPANSHAREPWQLEQVGYQLRSDQAFCCHPLSLFKYLGNAVPLVRDGYLGMGIDHSLEQRRARACTAHDEYIRIDHTGLRRRHFEQLSFHSLAGQDLDLMLRADRPRPVRSRKNPRHAEPLGGGDRHAQGLPMPVSVDAGRELQSPPLSAGSWRRCSVRI